MSSTTIGEHIRLRRARNQTIRHLNTAEVDPPLSHVVLPISQPNTFCNTSMSSFFLLPTSSSTKKKLSQTTSLRGMGCTATSAAQEVSVPSVIRSSADWDARTRKDKKKHKKKKSKKNKGSYEDGSIRISAEATDVDGGGGCVAIPDVWCGPGIGFSTDAVVDRSGDYPRRRNLQSSRRKINVDINNYSPRDVNLGSSVLPRRFIKQEPTLLSSRYGGHFRRPYPDDLNEMMMLQNSFIEERLRDSRDHYHQLRLDVDSMSYEQLLELGDRIGYVNTGLKESEIHHSLQKIKPPYISHTLADRKCSICQDEYEREDEVGKLNCEHSFHVHCVKQWLSRKNACPVCKKTAYVKP